MPPKRLPIVSTGRLKQECDQGSDEQHRERSGRPAQQSEALGQPVVEKEEDETGAGQPQGRQVDGMRVGGQGLDAAEELGRQVVDLQAEEILDLGEENDHRDAVGEADDHGDRNETDELPHAGDAHGEQEDAGENGGAHQVGVTVNGDDAIDDGDEGAGRATDLHARSAEERNDEAGDDGSPDACSGRNAGGDREGHGERQGEHADRDSRGQILAELRPVVGWQAVQQLRVEGDFHGAGSRGKRRIIWGSDYSSMVITC